MVLVTIVLPVNAFVSLAQSSYLKTKIVNSAHGTSSQAQEQRSNAIPFEVEYNQICLTGEINGNQVKAYYSSSRSSNTISSLQASTFLANGFISEKNVQGEIVFGTISAGATVVIPKLSFGNVVFTNVRCTVTDNLSYPFVVCERLFRHKGQVYVDQSNHTIYIY